MDAYSIVKTLHIISATIVFGTGLGIASLMLAGHRNADVRLRAYAARLTVRADFLFTLPSVIFQPLSGAWLVWHGGFSWDDRWLLATYALYLLAGICWLPVVAIQMRMKMLLEQAAQGQPMNEAAYNRLFRWWFALGWPAFGGLVVIFWLMVTKPA